MSSCGVTTQPPQIPCSGYTTRETETRSRPNLICKHRVLSNLTCSLIWPHCNYHGCVLAFPACIVVLTLISAFKNHLCKIEFVGRPVLEKVTSSRLAQRPSSCHYTMGDIRHSDYDLHSIFFDAIYTIRLVTYVFFEPIVYHL